MRRRRESWWCRGMLATLVFLAPLPALFWLRPVDYLQHAIYLGAEATGLLPPTPRALMASPLGGRTFPNPPRWLLKGASAVSVGVALIPGLVVALLVYDWLTFAKRWVWSDGHTRCGRCGCILRNLRTPVCPHCGQRI